MWSAMVSALIQRLIHKGIITSAEGREIYEDALLMLEHSQTRHTDSQEIFAAAREMIEQHLRSQ